MTVNGADDFLKLSKALKAAGRGDLRKELNKALKSAAKPLTPKTREAALSSIPSRGGLAGRVAKSPQRVQVRTGNTPGVSLIVTPRRGSGARMLDAQGAVRHPVWGNRENWVRQSVPGAKGWFSQTAQDNAPAIRNDLEQALEDFAARIVREAR